MPLLDPQYAFSVQNMIPEYLFMSTSWWYGTALRQCLDASWMPNDNHQTLVVAVSRISTRFGSN